MAEPVVCARAIMTPDNCVAETQRLIAAARLHHRRPVYMAFPYDYATLGSDGCQGLVSRCGLGAQALGPFEEPLPRWVHWRSLRQRRGEKPLGSLGAPSE